MLLSGFVFEIDSMPVAIQVVTYVIRRATLWKALQTLFLAGNIMPVIISNLVLLILSALVFIGLTALKTPPPA